MKDVLDTNRELLGLLKARRSGAVAKSASNARVQELKARFAAAIDKRLGAGTAARVHRQTVEDIERDGLDAVIAKELGS